MNFRFLTFFLATVTLSAAPITILSYGIIGFGTGMSGSVTQANDSLALSGPVTQGFNFSGNAVLFGAGQPVTPNQAFDGPLEFRFTDAVISCTGNAPCSGVIDLRANLFLSTTAVLPLSVGIEGTATGAPLDGFLAVEGTHIGQRPRRPVAGVGITFDPNPLPLRNLGGSNLSVQSVFSYAFASASAIPISSNVSLLLNLAFDNLAPGNTINLPNSAWISLGEPTSPVPEPGTILLLTAGMAGLFWFRRR